MIELETERTRLRGWRESDLEPFAALNADPVVMEHFPAPYSRAETAAQMQAFQQRLEDDGLGYLALEIKPEGRFAGFVGLKQVAFEAPFTPAVEIAWRLARWAWGQGYASEAARRCLAYGFEERGLERIVAFTARPNLRSQAVMRRIGMTHDPALDFEHPAVAEGHRLRPHVFHSVTRQDFAALSR